MTYAFLIASCVVFIELFIFLDLIRESHKIIADSHEAMRVVISDMDDREKETYMRRASLTMLLTTFRFLLKFFTICVALYAMYRVFIYCFPQARQSVLESLISPVAILFLTVVGTAYFWLRSVILK